MSGGWLTEPWTYPFMRWALLACLVLAGIHAYLGFHVVRRGVLFVDLAMAQMAALGSAVGVVLDIEHGTAAEYAISLGFALAAAALFASIRGRRIPAEAIIAAVYGLASAATFVVLEHSPHGMDEVKHLLVGQVLTVAPAKVLTTTIVYAVIGMVFIRLHARFLAASDGRDVTHPKWTEFAFFAAFSVVVTSSVSMVGVLLVFSFLVLPAIGGALIARPPARQLAVGWSLALASAFVGLHAAFHLDSPAAPIISLTLGAMLVVTSVLASRRRA